MSRSTQEHEQKSSEVFGDGTFTLCGVPFQILYLTLEFVTFLFADVHVLQPQMYLGMFQ